VFIYGDGTQTRSFCYIEDMIEQMTGIIESTKHGPINLGNDREYNLLQIVEKVSALLTHPLKIDFMQAQINDPIRRKPDLTQLSALGFSAKIDIDEGLKRTMAYFKSEIEKEGI
jgi:UDP-glucuronate decarboxylase